MSQTKTARVRYIPEGDAKYPEGYALEMETKYGWGLICFTQLRRSADIPDEPEKMFVHYTFLNKIFELLELGYRVYRI